MPSFEDEITSNFFHFSERWQAELTSVQGDLATSEAIYLASYKRLTSINAWRDLLLKNELSPESYGFFCEAQNDALSSHVFARLGSWRASLQSLRSCIENVLFSEYYRDHPIELRQWNQDRHRMGFSEMISYFRKHPDIVDIDAQLTGLDRIQTQYASLSRSVHSSAVSYRMTVPDGETNIWTSEISRLRSWNIKEHHTITGINFLLLCIHRSSLQGARLSGLRQAIGLTIRSNPLRYKIKSDFGVNLRVTT